MVTRAARGGWQGVTPLVEVEKRVQRLETTVNEQYSREDLTDFVESLVGQKVKEEVSKYQQQLQQQLLRSANPAAGAGPAKSGTGGYINLDDLKSDEGRVGALLDR